MIQRFLVSLFTFVWWKRLHRPHRFHPNFYPNYLMRSKVVKVKGWRTALIDDHGRGRATVTFLFGKDKVEE